MQFYSKYIYLHIYLKFIQIMRRIITLFALVALFATSAMAQNVNVTFQLNTSNFANDPAGYFIAGGTAFGVPGDNPMTQDGTDPNLWTITMSVPANTYLNYTFTNGNCGDWSCKENIAGLPCADAGNYNDRFLNVTQDTTILACFGSCESDGSCTAPPTPVNITFRVDMSNETVDPAGVKLAGGFQGWNDQANPMTDVGNGVWETTVTINPEIEIEWKFINGAWGGDEQFDSTTHAACTKTTVDAGGVFTNRYLASTGTVDAILPTYIFNSCATNSTKEVFTKDGIFEINPTLVTNEAIINFTSDAVAADKQIQVINAVGQVVMNETVGQAQQYRLDASSLANGMYFVVIQADGLAQTARIVVNK
jgi:hypothetical protein